MSINRDLEKLETGVEELIAVHQRDRDVTDFTKYADDPVTFWRQELDFHATEKQIEVALAYIAGKRTVARGHHGSGKDAVLAAIAMHACFCRGMLVLVLSATERQLLGQVWGEIAKRFRPGLPGELYSSDLRLNGQRRIIAMTAGSNSVSQLTGWHDPGGVCVLISESQSDSVSDNAFDSAEANTVDARSKIVVVGNPIATGTRFHAVHSRPSWQQVRMDWFSHPNYLEQREVIPGAPAPNWHEDVTREYGSDSAFYVCRVLAEFPSEGSVDSLLNRGWIRGAFDLHESGTLADEWAKVTLGVDVARFGGDRSVIALLRGRVVERFIPWTKEDTVQSADRVHELATSLTYWDRRIRDFNVPQLVVDDVGVGGGVTDNLRRIKKRDVFAFNGGNSPAYHHPPRFLNLRMQAAWTLRVALERGELALPRSETLLEELASLSYMINPKGLLVLVSKDDLRKVLKRSPDFADAVMMAVACSSGQVSQRATVFRVAV